MKRLMLLLRLAVAAAVQRQMVMGVTPATQLRLAVVALDKLHEVFLDRVVSAFSLTVVMRRLPPILVVAAEHVDLAQIRPPLKVATEEREQI